MNFGAMLPDVKASLPVSGQHVSADLHAVERACVPGIEADCAHSPFTSIMVRPIYKFPVLPILLILPARRLVRYHVEHPSARHCQIQRLRACRAFKCSCGTTDHNAALPVAPQLVAALCRTSTAMHPQDSTGGAWCLWSAGWQCIAVHVQVYGWSTSVGAIVTELATVLRRTVALPVREHQSIWNPADSTDDKTLFILLTPQTVSGYPMYYVAYQTEQWGTHFLDEGSTNWGVPRGQNKTTSYRQVGVAIQNIL